MASLPETSTWRAGVTQIETSELVLGGSGGVSNRGLLELADRTRYLYDRINALTALPLSAIPYPTIGTSDNKLAITPVNSGVAGGKVTVAAGQAVTVGELVTEGLTGRMLSLLTPSYTSAELLVSTTYYLRARVNAGILQIYLQRGTDTDAAPAGLIGTPDATSGGGFDSTVLDILLARVVTGVAATAPTVTALVNRAHLRLMQVLQVTANAALSWSALSGASVTLNWARTPAAQCALQGVAGISGKPNGLPLDSDGDWHNLKMMMLRTASSSSRYALNAEYAYDDSNGDNGSVSVLWTAIA